MTIVYNTHFKTTFKLNFEYTVSHTHKEIEWEREKEYTMKNYIFNFAVWTLEAWKFTNFNDDNDFQALNTAAKNRVTATFMLKFESLVFNWIDENFDTHRTHTYIHMHTNIHSYIRFGQFLLEKSIASTFILPVIQCVVGHHKHRNGNGWAIKSTLAKTVMVSYCFSSLFALCLMSISTNFVCIHLALTSIDTSLNYNLIDGQWTNWCEIFHY